MAQANLLDEVVATLRTVSPASEGRVLTGESRLVEDAGLDSLDLVSLLMALQDEMGIELDLDAVGGLQTLDDVVHLLGEARPRKAA
jgi:acyl carrier protein